MVQVAEFRSNCNGRTEDKPPPNFFYWHSRHMNSRHKDLNLHGRRNVDNVLFNW